MLLWGLYPKMQHTKLTHVKHPADSGSNKPHGRSEICLTLNSFSSMAFLTRMTEKRGCAALGSCSSTGISQSFLLWQRAVTELQSVHAEAQWGNHPSCLCQYQSGNTGSSLHPALTHQTPQWRISCSHIFLSPSAPGISCPSSPAAE